MDKLVAVLSSRLVLRFADKDAEDEFTAMCFRAIVPACIVLSTLHVGSHVLALYLSENSVTAIFIMQTSAGVAALISHAVCHMIEDSKAAHRAFVMINEGNVYAVACVCTFSKIFCLWAGRQCMFAANLVALECFLFFAVGLAIHLLVFPLKSCLRISAVQLAASLVPALFGSSWTGMGQPNELVLLWAAIASGYLVGLWMQWGLRKIFLSRQAEKADLVARLAEATAHSTNLEQARREQLVANKLAKGRASGSGVGTRRTAAAKARGTALDAIVDDGASEWSSVGSGSSGGDDLRGRRTSPARKRR